MEFHSFPLLVPYGNHVVSQRRQREEKKKRTGAPLLSILYHLSRTQRYNFFFILISLCNNYNNIYNNIITNNYSLIFIWIFSLDLYRMSPLFFFFFVFSCFNLDVARVWWRPSFTFSFHFYYIFLLFFLFFNFSSFFITGAHSRPLVSTHFDTLFRRRYEFYRTILPEWRMIELIS